MPLRQCLIDQSSVLLAIEVLTLTEDVDLWPNNIIICLQRFKQRGLDEHHGTNYVSPSPVKAIPKYIESHDEAVSSQKLTK